MSNIRSMDYHRRTMDSMQQEITELKKRLAQQEEWNAWQNMVTDTLEVQFSELKSQYDYVLDNMLLQLRAISAHLSAKGYTE